MTPIETIRALASLGNGGTLVRADLNDPTWTQQLPGGLGVVADDCIAGLTACATLQLGLYAFAKLRT